MRILQVSSAQEIGGGEKHFGDLVKDLAGRGHEVHVITRPESPITSLLNGSAAIKLHQLPLRNAMDVGSSSALARLARQLHFDVVHAHVARDYPVCGRATRAAGVPFVVTRHHFNPLRGGLFAEWSLRNVAYLIAVSRAVAETLTSSLPHLAERVRVIPNWISTSSVSPLDRSAAREKLGISRPLCIAIIGKVSPLKGQALFVEMASLVAKSRNKDDVEFVIVGSAQDHHRGYYEQLKTSAMKANLNERVRFVGFIQNVAELMSAFDVVVAPSENEAFSLVVAEAMAAKAAVVGSARGGIKELIQEGTGVLVPEITAQAFADAVIALLDDSARRNLMGEVARASIISRYERSKVIDQIEALYRTLPTGKK